MNIQSLLVIAIWAATLVGSASGQIRQSVIRDVNGVRHSLLEDQNNDGGVDRPFLVRIDANALDDEIVELIQDFGVSSMTELTNLVVVGHGDTGDMLRFARSGATGSAIVIYADDAVTYFGSESGRRVLPWITIDFFTPSGRFQNTRGTYETDYHGVRKRMVGLFEDYLTRQEDIPALAEAEVLLSWARTLDLTSAEMIKIYDPLLEWVLRRFFASAEIPTLVPPTLSRNERQLAENALGAVNDAIALEPRGKLLNTQGRLFWLLGNREDAALAFRRATAASPIMTAYRRNAAKFASSARLRGFREQPMPAKTIGALILAGTGALAKSELGWGFISERDRARASADSVLNRGWEASEFDPFLSEWQDAQLATERRRALTFSALSLYSDAGIVAGLNDRPGTRLWILSAKSVALGLTAFALSKRDFASLGNDGEVIVGPDELAREQAAIERNRIRVRTLAVNAALDGAVFLGFLLKGNSDEGLTMTDTYGGGTAAAYRRRF